MENLPRRNIGVTGFMTPQEIDAVQKTFSMLNHEHRVLNKGGVYPRFMIGILVSAKTAVKQK